MTEWFKVLVLKTIVLHDTVGSNPTLSFETQAKFQYKIQLCIILEFTLMQLNLGN